MSATPRDALDSLLAALPPGATRKKMFGADCLSAGGKGFATLTKEGLALKLSGEDHARALALSGAELWDPSGRGRAMREWVHVPAAHRAEWPSLAEAAMRYVADGAS
jgi:hypothetical protein